MESNTAVGISETIKPSVLTYKTCLRYIKYAKKSAIIIASVVTMCGILYTLLAMPEYQTTILLENKSYSALSGIVNSTFNGVPIIRESMPREIELINTAPLIERFINQHHLDIQIHYHYFPIVGSFLAKHFQQRYPNALATPYLNMRDYAWGGENIVIKQLTLPDTFINLPLQLKVVDQTTYILKINGLVYKGIVGAVTYFKLPNGEMATILITNMVANPGLQATITKIPEKKLIKKIKHNLTVDRAALDSGLIKLQFKGKDPILITDYLNGIGQAAVSLSIERAQQQANIALQFLHDQLQLAGRQINQDQIIITNMRAQNHIINDDAKTQQIMTRLAQLDNDIEDNQVKMAGLLQRVTKLNPSYLELTKINNYLMQQHQDLMHSIEALPASQVNIDTLQRDIDVKNKVYELLLYQIQQLQIVKEGKIGSINIAQPAVVPNFPVTLNRAIFILLSLAVGIILGLVYAIAYTRYKQKIFDKRLEYYFAIPVYLKLPVKKPNLANQTITHEIRELRNVLLEDTQSISFLSLTNVDDASVVALNLANSFASVGKKTLLIDVSFNHSSISTDLNIKHQLGLIDLLIHHKTITNLEIESVIQTIGSPGFHYIASGSDAENLSDLLVQTNVAAFVQTLSKNYEGSFIVPPALLSTANSLVVVKWSKDIFMIVNAMTDSYQDVADAIVLLAKNKLNVRGFILTNTI